METRRDFINITLTATGLTLPSHLISGLKRSTQFIPPSDKLSMQVLGLGQGHPTLLA